MVRQILPQIDKTGIKLTRQTKRELDEVKIIPEEPYDKVVRRLIEEHKRALEESA